MNTQYHAKENKTGSAGRESFSGRPLTNRQFEDFKAVVGIMRRHIQHSGVFTDKLSDFAYAIKRSEKFDVVKAETILRDLFKEEFGKTMNQFREELAKNEEALGADHRAQAYARACNISDMMENGDKLTFHRACADQMQQFADEHGVTHVCAYRLMNEQFLAVEGIELREWGKELDERFYRPQIEAEKAEREAARTQPEDDRPQARSTEGVSPQLRPRFRARSGPQ